MQVQFARMQYEQDGRASEHLIGKYQLVNGVTPEENDCQYLYFPPLTFLASQT